VMQPERRSLLRAVGAGATGAAALTAAGLVFGGGGPSGGRAALASMSGAPQWLNTGALSSEQLAGKVVLVNFWTYTCINSLRPLPYVRAWAEKYRDRGLVVIGAHTPEFSFEHDLENVRRAVERQGVTFPVVLDNEYEIWRSFSNSAWPGFYFIDRTGRVRERVLGEGNYQDSERMIQRLLSESGAGVHDAIVDIPGEGAQAAPNWSTLRSPESYVGYSKASGFASRGGLRENEAAQYERQPSFRVNQWGLSGRWVAGDEFAETVAPDAAIQFRFHARDLHCVMARRSASDHRALDKMRAFRWEWAFAPLARIKPKSARRHSEIGDDRSALKSGEQERRSVEVVSLAHRQHEPHRQAVFIDDGVDLCAQSATRTVDGVSECR
jgi:thiol-disulfide isomerase/thioredoxin